MKKFIKENKTSLSIVLGAVIVLITFTSVQSMKQDSIERQLKEKQTAEENERFLSELKYSACLEDSYNDYMNNWNSECSAQGKEDDCRLVVSNAERFNKVKEKRDDTCLEMYKLRMK